MVIHHSIFYLVSLITLCAAANSDGRISTIVGGGDNSFEIYIVHVRKPLRVELMSDNDLENWHTSFLPNATLDSGEPRLIYSYREAISGFAALLTGEEAKAMEAMEGVLHMEPDGLLVPQTTHTPSVLGFVRGGGLWENTSYGEGIIIGVLDSGAHPTHVSFGDQDVPEPPWWWHGRCEFKGALCNNKIIGARAFVSHRKNAVPNDDDGHGTHVASIAAGNFVDNADVLGSATGTAVGMAPRAHLAIYKVSQRSDRIAGIDAAIQDGVHLMSISLGNYSSPIKYDSVAVASFVGIKKKILTVAAAGNAGPDPDVLDNVAPWILSVGASTTDRRIKVTATLGNGDELEGETGYQPDSFSSRPLPLVDGRDCSKQTISNITVAGMIVACDIAGAPGFLGKGEVVKSAGGVAMILMNGYYQGSTTYSLAHVLPAVQVGYLEANKIYNYFDLTENMTSATNATLVFKGTEYGALPSPAIPYFSSRGPSALNGNILKPDIVAPGHNILAAWPFTVGPNASSDTSNSTFNIISGTSMATPHVSGIAALIKKAHPDWSPAAIKSAIMTTAYTLDRLGKGLIDQVTGKPATPYAMGAGHINPLKAVNPGLVYNTSTDDYIGYLCGLWYTDIEIEVIAQQRLNCSTIESIKAEELNYPSISVSLDPSTTTTKTITRTVTNVGAPDSEYTVHVDEPNGATVDVNPKTLQFSSYNEQKSFSVNFTVNATHPGKDGVSDGMLSWSSKGYDVKSVMVVTF